MIESDRSPLAEAPAAGTPPAEAPAVDDRPLVVMVAGTRPEAIKLAPLRLAVPIGLRAQLVTTGQHGAVVSRTLGQFGITPDRELRCARGTGTLHELFASIVVEVGRAIDDLAPTAVVVQGDTSSAAAAAVAAFYHRVPVVHLEAGLSTSSIGRPFPEEAHRRLIADLAALHLAPTAGAADNLRARGVADEAVVITGNTVVDALVAMLDRPVTVPRDEVELRPGLRTMVVTAHRRESWGEPMRRIASAIRTATDADDGLETVVVLHPNPAVAADMRDLLGDHERIRCVEPLDYGPFARLLARSDVVVTDSGGLQEELPSLGVPAVIVREETERNEAIDAGTAMLAGTDADRIVRAIRAALSAGRRPAGSANPFGDGRATVRCWQAVSWMLGLDQRPVDHRVPALD